MIDLKFNIYAMSDPKTMEDMELVLSETLMELEHLNELLDELERRLSGKQ